ncbi:MAG: condensation domain-containing protein, partial [Gammaproteobacteria bacterium]|nr:condensation domain-containing protein [Gammaproteobacteria bacterium]
MTNLKERLANLPPEKRAWVLKKLHEQRAAAANGVSAGSVACGASDQNIPLSFAQQRLWFLNQLEGPSATYNIFDGWHLQGPLNVTALKQSLTEMVRRHESLRTTFAAPQGKPIQVIHPPDCVTLDVMDLQAVPAAEQLAEVQRRAAQEAAQCFDLERGSLLRVKLLHTAPEDHYLLFTIHHIVADGWSMSVIVQELSDLYTAFARGKPSSLPP